MLSIYTVYIFAYIFDYQYHRYDHRSCMLFFVFLKSIEIISLYNTMNLEISGNFLMYIYTNKCINRFKWLIRRYYNVSRTMLNYVKSAVIISVQFIISAETTKGVNVFDT